MNLLILSPKLIDSLDISDRNILLQSGDPSALDRLAQSEIDDPTPREIVNGMPVYASKGIKTVAGLGTPVLSDLGSAVAGDEQRNHDAQPNFYRCPEAMLTVNWSYPIDIWNLGAMVGCASRSRMFLYSTKLMTDPVGLAPIRGPTAVSWPGSTRTEIPDSGPFSRSYRHTRAATN